VSVLHPAVLKILNREFVILLKLNQMCFPLARRQPFLLFAVCVTFVGFSQYLDDFFYTDLSQQAKLGGLGNVKRAAFLMDEIRHQPGVDAQIRRYSYAQLGQAVAPVLALARKSKCTSILAYEKTPSQFGNWLRR